MTACNCIGPQNGEPLCPCMMRNVKIIYGRYVRVEDLGPAMVYPSKNERNALHKALINTVDLVDGGKEASKPFEKEMLTDERINVGAIKRPTAEDFLEEFNKQRQALRGNEENQDSLEKLANDISKGRD